MRQIPLVRYNSIFRIDQYLSLNLWVVNVVNWCTASLPCDRMVVLRWACKHTESSKWVRQYASREYLYLRLVAGKDMTSRIFSDENVMSWWPNNVGQSINGDDFLTNNTGVGKLSAILSKTLPRVTIVEYTFHQFCRATKGVCDYVLCDLDL